MASPRPLNVNRPKLSRVDVGQCAEQVHALAGGQSFDAELGRARQAVDRGRDGRRHLGRVVVLMDHDRPVTVGQQLALGIGRISVELERVHAEFGIDRECRSGHDLAGRLRHQREALDLAVTDVERTGQLDERSAVTPCIRGILRRRADVQLERAGGDVDRIGVVRIGRHGEERGNAGRHDRSAAGVLHLRQQVDARVVAGDHFAATGHPDHDVVDVHAFVGVVLAACDREVDVIERGHCLERGIAELIFESGL